MIRIIGSTFFLFFLFVSSIHAELVPIPCNWDKPDSIFYYARMTQESCGRQIQKLSVNNNAVLAADEENIRQTLYAIYDGFWNATKKDRIIISLLVHPHDSAWTIPKAFSLEFVRDEDKFISERIFFACLDGKFYDLGRGGSVKIPLQDGRRYDLVEGYITVFAVIENKSDRGREWDNKNRTPFLIRLAETNRRNLP